MGSADFSRDYIVRIYRFEKDKPRSLVGLVEEVGKRGKRGFNSFDELWEILNSSTKDPKDTPSPLAGRRSRARGGGGGEGGGDENRGKLRAENNFCRPGGSLKQIRKNILQGGKIMEKRKIILAIVLIFIISIWMLPNQAWAETWKNRIVIYFTRMEMVPIPTLEGQAYFLTEFRGLTFWENGEISNYSGAAIGESYKGKGPVQNCITHTFADGSTIVAKNKFINISAPDGKTALWEDITGEIVKGTGRFEGIKGTITAKGKRVAPISPGLKEMRGDGVVEGSMTFTLPSK